MIGNIQFEENTVIKNNHKDYDIYHNNMNRTTMRKQNIFYPNGRLDEDVDAKLSSNEEDTESVVACSLSCSVTGSSFSSSEDMDVEDSSDINIDHMQCDMIPEQPPFLYKPQRSRDHPLLFLEMDLIQTIFEQLIVSHAMDSDVEDRTGVFYRSFKDIITFTKRVSKRLNRHTDNKSFWLCLHQACYRQRNYLGSAFKEVSFKTTYIHSISHMSQGELCTNLFDMVFGDTEDLKRKRALAVELSFRHALQLQRHYVPAVFYKNTLSDMIYVRKAVMTDHPSVIQYLIKEEFEVLMMAIYEMETKTRLECYSTQFAEKNTNNKLNMEVVART